METAKPPAPQAPAAPLGKSFADALEFAALLTPGQRLIGIDLGTKTIGLALSDVTRTIASPLETIIRVKFTPDIQKLFAIAETHKIGGFVLGLPVNMIGDEGPRAQATRSFARNVNKLSPIPLLFWDERLTTAQAERTLIEADTTRKRRGEVIDKMAAALILQGAIDRIRFKPAVQDAEPE
jgi:putative holliday junction resolvase